MANWKPRFDQELDRIPLTVNYHNFTTPELSLRREIAKCLWDDMMDNDGTWDPDSELRKTYEKFPPWAFFTDHFQRIWRVYGIKNKTKMRAITLGVNNDGVLIASVNMSSLRMVSNWTDSQKKKIQENGVPGWFSDPLGMMFILTNFCKKNE